MGGSYQAYQTRVVDCTTPVDVGNVKGKSVVITGGAGGMGEQATRAFVKAGAFVTFGDLNDNAGQRLQDELRPNAHFVKCDVASFESQKALFKAAKEHSPSKTVDVAVANAGISQPDPIYKDEDVDGEPTAPNLKTLEVNVNGVLYTFKLARFYFLQHELKPGRDRCFIVLSSAAGYFDVPGRLVYMTSKFAARATMRCIRRSTATDGIRGCALAPWFVETNLVDAKVMAIIKSKNVKFADAADAAGAMLRIASDTSINGRCFAIVHRDEAPLGHYDMDIDDFAEDSTAGDYQAQMLAISHAS